MGRGRLEADAVYLRIERIGRGFTTLVSENGKSWFTCDEIEFNADTPQAVFRVHNRVRERAWTNTGHVVWRIER